MFPFQNINRDDLLRTADELENVMLIRDALSQCGFSVSETKFEAISVAIQYLKTEKAFTVGNKTFLDCLGCRGEGSMYAIAFGFGNLLSIEVTKKTLKQGQRLVEIIAPQIGGKLDLSQITFETGGFNQFDVNGFDCIFMDVTIFRSTLIDESTLIAKFLEYCSMANVGSFFILVTTVPTINLHDYCDYSGRFRLLLDASVGTKVTEEERQGLGTVGIFEVVEDVQTEDNEL